ncbi:Tim44-like domain protein [hydrothermal vent metagenome]|uniref:Tim44-like domain protein n=1 Tax=hydrothermal vent metagenome TaxID=652676 RepID=A0A3B0SG78_9ZZZZ
MNSPMIQLLVLAGIAVFLIIRLKNVLGTRDGFEVPPKAEAGPVPARRKGFEVINGGPDRDITDHIGEDTDAAAALAEMKRAEPSFNLTQFLQGAKGAYEMILMAFERGRMDEITPFLEKDVFEAFSQVVDAREAKGLSVEAEFIGVRETTLMDARFDQSSGQAEIIVKFVGELTSVVRDKDGNIVEGAPDQSRRQKDIWTFERIMGSGDPNWRLVATGE